MISGRLGNTLLFVNAGVGYSFDSSSHPLDLEFGAKKAVRPYMSGDNFIKSWIRSFSLTVSYRF